jgi:cyanophycinase-like exopeptidase
MPVQPGWIALIGSGETAANGGRTFEALAGNYSPPLRAAVLETPAGFELNSAQVAGRVAEYLERRLRNYAPEVWVLPARRRGDALGPDNPEVLAPLATADLIFMGPGSPTYAVRQLQGSLAWQAVLARHSQGASVALASAAAIAAGSAVLPVYEIYKAGEDPNWRDGLDLLGRYGLRLAIVPHWNNAEGGADLDTSRCFMGGERFAALAAMLPEDIGILGIDEHTTLLVNPAAARCKVLGQGGVTVVRAGVEQRYASGDAFPASALGPWRDAGEPLPLPDALTPYAVLAKVDIIPDGVQALASAREAARAGRDWAQADALRDRIAALGWQVRDTPEGPQVVRR